MSTELQRTYKRSDNGDFIKHPYKPMKQRFYERTTIPNKKGCMIWIGSKSGGTHEYGQIIDYLNKPRNVYAHRFSYALHFGPFDSKLHVLHKCDNPKCVAPEHLFLGTPKDNMHDCMKKGRAKQSHPRPGQINPSAKLNDDDVREIRRLITKGLSVNSIAEKFNVRRQTIGGIKNNRTWRHVV